MEDILDQKYDTSLILCESYYSLVNTGWNDSDIYDQLENAGAFDGWDGAGHEFFHALIRWCYKND